MNNLSLDKLKTVRRLLANGHGIRRAGRQAGVSYNTVMKVAEDSIELTRLGDLSFALHPVGGRTALKQTQIVFVNYLYSSSISDLMRSLNGGTVEQGYDLLASIGGWNPTQCPCGLEKNHPEHCWWFYHNRNERVPGSKGRGKQCKNCVLFIAGGVGVYCRVCFFAALQSSLFPRECQKCGLVRKNYCPTNPLCKTCSKRNCESCNRPMSFGSSPLCSSCERQIERGVDINSPEYRAKLKEMEELRCLNRGRKLLNKVRKMCNSPETFREVSQSQRGAYEQETTSQI